MAKLTMQLTDDATIEVDIGPGIPRPTGIAFEYQANTPEELDTLIETLGGLDAFAVYGDIGWVARYALPVLEDGEKVASGRVSIRAGDAMREPQPLFPVLARLQDEKDELVHRARLEAS